MEKFCIFCGGKPENKNLEHVLPQWLIELTGNPKRTVRFGYKKSGKGKFAERRFAFDAFKFPACRKCNEKSGNLEAGAKVIIDKMMLKDPLSESELNTLLDWFDKVRIGLWLGYLYLDKNPLGISPHFYIRHRIGQYDRMLAIFEAGGNVKGLTFVGCDTPAFAQTPSCFSLGINNLWFLNMSHPYLLARRMGFPFPMDTYMLEDGRLYCTLDKGRNRIMKPVLKKSASVEGAELYQPIFVGHLAGEDNKRVKSQYDTEYVRDNCISWEEGIGKIYIKRGSEVNAYGTSPSIDWSPKKSHDAGELYFNIQLMTLEWQLYMMKTWMPMIIKSLSGERRSKAIRLINLTKEYNRKMVKHLSSVERY